MSNPFESVGKCYNSRSPAENDGMCYTLMTRDNTRYNSRSLLRRATPLAVEPLDDALATTHALLRRATTISAKKICVISLQLTLSCGERPQMCALWQALWVLQLTLSCGERLSMVHSSFLCYGATTRALLRRATL